MASYLTGFAIILGGSALAVHFAFVTILKHDLTVRLYSLSRIADSVVDWRKTNFSVDLNDETIRNLNPSTEGVQWYDPTWRLVASYGLVAPRADTPSGTLRSMTVVTHNPDDPKDRGFIRLSLSEAPLDQSVRKLDISMLGVYVLALLASAIAGRYLTSQALRPVEANMRTLQEFTADAAHELRGPLTAILTSAATATPGDGETLRINREHLRSISSAASQMTRLTNDLLILARASRSLERELFVVDVGASVKRIVSLYRDEAQRRGVTLVSDDSGAYRVYGNPDEIDRIFGNLVENGIRYTQAGGKVSISCKHDRTGCRVTVSDTGIGIEPGHFEYVFERFWRADGRSADGGSGLGLAIAKVLARRHGGDITVSSILGEGSEFVVRLPSRPP